MFGTFSKRIGLLALGGVIGLGAVAMGEDQATEDAYPLTTCVVSGEKLGEMGEPTVIEYEGREVRFCCAGCEKDFRKEPEKYLKILDEAAATRPTTQPAE